MLDRYRKPGGFNQLLSLMETCGPIKQEKFLQIVREQDAAWAQALEGRILTIARIFTWKDGAIAEISPALTDLTVATALHGLDETQRAAFTRLMTFSQKRNILDLYESSRPTPAEINTTMQKVLTEARRLIADGRLRLSDIDPDLIVPDDIEERLKKGPSRALKIVPPAATVETIDPADYEPIGEQLADIGDHVTSVMATASNAEAISKLEASLRDENMALRRKLAAVVIENSALKQDLVRLQMRIDQIRKMAA